MAAAAQAAENQGEPNSNLTPLKFASKAEPRLKISSDGTSLK